VINREALDKIHSYTQIGRDEGAELLTGGEVASGNGLDKGFYYRPTVFGEVEPGMRIAQEEIFGPTTALLRVSSFEEAVRVANGIEYGLSSAIFTRDVNKAFRAMRDLVAGITYINAGTTGAEVHLPFGGTKAGAALSRVRAPTLLIVGGDDAPVIQINREALGQVRAPAKLVVVPGAGHLFEEPGTLEEVARLARDWFLEQFRAEDR